MASSGSRRSQSADAELVDGELVDGVEVLAPDKEHVLHRGVVVDCEGGCSQLPAGYRVVERLDTGKAFGLPAGRLVSWAGYARRVLQPDGCDHKPIPAVPEAGSAAVAVWRCEIWTEGLFSLLFWALGWLQAESRMADAAGAPRHLLIDWTDNRILFHGGSQPVGCANVWNAFFEQPPTADGLEPLTSAALEAAEHAGRLSVVVRFGRPWFSKFGEFRGADEGGSDFADIKGGRLDAAGADDGRAAFRRWVRVRSGVLDRAALIRDGALGDLPDTEWLAVHVRRTDKLEQCRANRLERAELASQVRTFCAALQLPAVFLCTDDADMKRSLRQDLEAAGLRVAAHDEALLSEGCRPAHKDETLDRRRNAEDVLVEVLLMSRCGALLSTYSNVSVAAVYFSKPGYRHFMFGDAPPVRLAQAVAPGATEARGAAGAAPGVAAVPERTTGAVGATAADVDAARGAGAGAPAAGPGADDTERRCGACGAGGADMCCSRCRLAFFCDRECQRRAWSSHKKQCAPA